jgi:hypothetical protein
VKAVTLILKHATFLRISNSPKSALIKAEEDYQKANIDMTIQQHLTACGSKQSVEQFMGFIMSTNIGLFIFFPFVNINILLSFLASSQSSADAGT